MPNRTFQISVNLNQEQRSQLLIAVPPRFINIWCRQFVWYYKVPEDYVHPTAITLTLDGHHIGAGHEALVGIMEDEVGNHYGVRPDNGSRLHITLSSDDGVPPAAGGTIDSDNVFSIEPIRLSLTLSKDHAQRLTPERRQG